MTSEHPLTQTPPAPDYLHHTDLAARTHKTHNGQVKGWVGEERERWRRGCLDDSFTVMRQPTSLLSVIEGTTLPDYHRHSNEVTPLTGVDLANANNKSTRKKTQRVAGLDRLAAKNKCALFSI